MDWFSTYRAFVNCFKRKVTFTLPFGDLGCFVGDRVDVPMRSLHTLCKGKGHVDLLTSLFSSEVDPPLIEFPPVVCEYTDVFPEDLPRCS